MPTTYAAINIGSNELSMKIVEIVRKTEVRELTHMRHATELGTDTYIDGSISNESISEICRALSGFLDVMNEFGVMDYDICGGSALREALNSITVLDRVRIRCGLKIKILSNSEQRFLRYKAIAFGGDRFNEMIQRETAIVDVGGGSTQFSLFGDGSLAATQNIPLGSLRIKDLLRYIESQADDYNDLMGEYVSRDVKILQNMYPLTGRIENLIAIGDQLYDLKRFAKLMGKGDVLTRADFDETYTRLLSLTPVSISRQLGVPVEQAMLLLPTMMVYHRFLSSTKVNSIWLCNVTLCDGMVTEYIEREKRVKPPHDFTVDALSSARHVANRYQSDVPHTGNVENLTLRIFDGMRRIHGMSKRDRLLLQIAVILHDCGSFVNMRNTPENSHMIIMATELIGLTHAERELVAHMVRYNTKDFPSHKHLSHLFGADDYIKIMKLVAIFRIAHSLDTSRQQKCLDVRVTLVEDQLHISVTTAKELTLEKTMFNQKAAFFEQVYGIQPILRQKRRLHSDE